MISVFTKPKQLLAPVSGRVVPLKSANARGLAIIPTSVKIYAPISGAVSLADGEGAEIFVNAARGIIQLRGKFACTVKNGSRIEAGALIAVIGAELFNRREYMPRVLLIMPKTTAVKPIDTEWVQGGESALLKIMQ